MLDKQREDSLELLAVFENNEEFNNKITSIQQFIQLAVNHPEMKEHLARRLKEDSELLNTLVVLFSDASQVRVFIDAFPDQKEFIINNILNKDNNTLQNIVREVHDISLLIGTFPESQNQLLEAILNNDELISKLLLFQPLDMMNTFPQLQEAFLLKIANNANLLADFVDYQLAGVCKSQYQFDYDTYYFFIKELLKHPDKFQQLVDRYGLNAFYSLYPDIAKQVYEHTIMYNTPFDILLKDAAGYNDLSILTTIQGTITDKELKTPQDLKIRNSLVRAISELLTEQKEKQTVTPETLAILLNIQKQLLSIPVPSLFATTRYFIQHQKLKDNEEILSNDLKEELSKDIEEGLSRLFPKG